jgi:two-component system, chemotaxis family, sensor kinase CheA
MEKCMKLPFLSSLKKQKNELLIENQLLKTKLQHIENDFYVTKEEFSSTSNKYLELLKETQDQNKKMELLQSETEKINKQLKEQIIKANQMTTIAKSANAAKDIFLANMSHEFRTPLNIIMNHTETLIEDGGSGEKYDNKIIVTLQIIYQRSVELLRLVSDLMDIAKIEAGQLTLVKEKVVIKDVVKDVVMGLKNDIKNKNVKLKIRFGNHIPKHAIIDSLRLKQVLFNLVSNAIKFTDRGHIIVDCQKQLPSKEQHNSNLLELMFSVSDTGIGIPKEKHSCLFKPFVQVQESAKKKCGGTGLGLAISKRIVEMMGGDIIVENNVPNGTTFTFTIAVENATDATTNTAKNATTDSTTTNTHDDGQPAESVSRKIIATNPINILVVEDDLNTADITCNLIERSDIHGNIKILRAENGQEAMSIYKNTDIDIILTDMMMPIMDGYALMTQIRAMESRNNVGKKVVIVATTAYAMEEDRQRCMSHGADYYIPKPMRRTDFTNIVNEAILLAEKLATNKTSDENDANETNAKNC